MSDDDRVIDELRAALDEGAEQLPSTPPPFGQVTATSDHHERSGRWRLLAIAAAAVILVAGGAIVAVTTGDGGNDPRDGMSTAGPSGELARVPNRTLSDWAGFADAVLLVTVTEQGDTESLVTVEVDDVLWQHPQAPSPPDEFEFIRLGTPEVGHQYVTAAVDWPGAGGGWAPLTRMLPFQDGHVMEPPEDERFTMMPRAPEALGSLDRDGVTAAMEEATPHPAAEANRHLNVDERWLAVGRAEGAGPSTSAIPSVATPPPATSIPSGPTEPTAPTTDTNADFSTPCPTPEGGWRPPPPSTWMIDGEPNYPQPYPGLPPVESVPGYGGHWWDSSTGVLNVRVAGDQQDRDAATDTIGDMTSEPFCIVEGTRSLAEIGRIRDEIDDEYVDVDDSPITETGFADYGVNHPSGLVVVTLRAPDRDLVEELHERYGDAIEIQRTFGPAGASPTTDPAS